MQILKWITNSWLIPMFLTVQSGYMSETMPDTPVIFESPSHRPLKVYAEYKYIHEYLKDERFQLTDTKEEADIWWLTSHLKDYRWVHDRSTRFYRNWRLRIGLHFITSSRPMQLICKTSSHCRRSVADRKGLQVNQLPCEHLLTVKDLLAIVGRRAGTGQITIQTTAW